MFKHKRVSLLLLILIFSLSFSATAQDGSGTFSLVFWDNSDGALSVRQGMVDQFHQIYPGIEVELIGVPGADWGEYLTGVATLLAGGEQPDVIHFATEGLRLMKGLELIQPLDTFIEGDPDIQATFDDIAEPLVDAYRIDGEMWGIPFEWNSNNIHYNTKHLEEAGLEPPPPTWTRDEFLEYAKAHTIDADGDGQPERYGYGWNMTPIIVQSTWVLANGGHFLTDDMCAPNLSAPEVIDAFQFLYDTIYTYKVSPLPDGTSQPIQQFMNGDVSMWHAGRWPIATYMANGFTESRVL